MMSLQAIELLEAASQAIYFVKVMHTPIMSSSENGASSLSIIFGKHC